MAGSRNRLINAARRSMIQRAEMRRKLDTARDAFTPRALLDRGKYRARTGLEDAAHIAREEFRDNRLPVAIAAGAGLAWLFREPIREHGPRAVRRLRDLIDAGIDRLRGERADNEQEDMENDDEAPQ
jgi:hypothetical protein